MHLTLHAVSKYKVALNITRTNHNKNHKLCANFTEISKRVVPNPTVVPTSKDYLQKLHDY